MFWLKFVTELQKDRISEWHSSFLGSALPLYMGMSVHLCRLHKKVKSQRNLIKPHQVPGGTRFYSTSVQELSDSLSVYQYNWSKQSEWAVHWKFSLQLSPCQIRVPWPSSAILRLAKCSPFPKNGFSGWMALGKVPMAGAAKSGRPGLDQSSRTSYWRVYRSETNKQVTPKQETDSYLTTWCVHILLTFSGKWPSHYEKQRQLYKYDHVLQLGRAKFVLADQYVFTTTGRRKVYALPSTALWWFLK